jgi:hypothetical protein
VPAALVIHKPARVGARSRSFVHVPPGYKDVTSRAAAHIRHYTFFENPMLTADEFNKLLDEAWEDAEQQTGTTLARDRRVDGYVSADINHRHRATH